MRILFAIAATLLLAPCEAAAQARIDNDTLTLPTELPTGEYALETAFESTRPATLTSPPGERDQLFIGGLDGVISVVRSLETSSVSDIPFLDISDRTTANGENGLLGLAFHPDYASNGYFFVFYTTSENGSARNRLSRFTQSEADPFLADPESELVLIDQIDNASNHNGGDIHFGPDRYLYVALGDEGGGNDSHNNGQRVDKDFFAGLLRIDVDKREGSFEPTGHPAVSRYTGGLAAYSVPPDNPLVDRWLDESGAPNSSLRTEFYAIGLRNPWRFSFDPSTGKLWVGDVGQGSYEEVNLVEKGGNYGWPIREGPIAGPKALDPPGSFETLTEAVHAYGRSVGYSITGGVVYRGARLPELYGAYIFGDFGSGRVFALRRSMDGSSPEVSQVASFPSHVGYGIDPSNGDVLIAGISGSIRRLVRAGDTAEPSFPVTLDETGAFKNLDTLQPEEGLYPYQPNVSFWSDHGIKSRWVSVPHDTQIGYSQDEPWVFPTGTVWVKHFELELERGNPDSRTRVETRFLVKTEQGAYGISYRWNAEGTDAVLADENGESITYTILDGDRAIEQTWNIPSRQQCLGCHTQAAGYALSFNTRQLNRDNSIDDEQTNLLQYFSDIGILDTKIEQPERLPKFHAADDDSASLEQRARSYLAVNCVACHQPNSSAPPTWDARPHLDIADAGLLNAMPINSGGDAEKRLVVRGSPERSLLLDRVAGSDGLSRMPPFGSSVLDQSGIKLLTDWISLLPPNNARFAEWQMAHFGDAETLEAQPDQDPDSDGNSNRLEFLNRTHPLDPASFWRPSFERNQSSISVRFPMSPARLFAIQISDDLSDWDEWETPGNPPEADGLETIDAEISGQLPAGQDSTFFRVRVEESQ